ncbi:hypothetical protein [Pedobacter cryophilus]|uniref:DUF4199 domain-containing protein n=1 Tax=Pedobacter cryophilus TaxID=2571271 RepID=A0A4U1C101_9SPHI|nr:hypothetical protein [Pedobacter cryophilus]TKB98715.1 hypothetical protein FA046_06250 [Pedobacter cryophilus]
MKKILFSLKLLLCVNFVFAQTPQDSITIKKSLSTLYLQNGKILKPKQLLEITKTNPIAFEAMTKAKKNVVPATIFGSIGGFFIGYPLGAAISGAKMNWALFGIGAGATLISLPFSVAYGKHAKTAITTYNQGLQKTSYRKIDLESTLGANGVGLKLKF